MADEEVVHPNPEEDPEETDADERVNRGLSRQPVNERIAEKDVVGPNGHEELQSTNEEHQTAREGPQSANEELQTVNGELLQRNDVLTQTGNDLTNLLNSINVPLLMLTSDLRIRQFTPSMQRLLNVRPADIGRSISEIRLRLSIDNIEPLLTEVLETLATRELEVQDREGRWNLLRVLPYRTSDNKIEGLVVILVDIDQLRRSQQHLVDARDFASSVVESVPVPIVVLDQDCTVRTVNTAFRDLTRMQAEDLENQPLPDLVNILWGIEDIAKRLEALLHSQPSVMLEFEHESTTAQKKILLIKARALPMEGSRIFLLMIEDITLRREAERLLAKQTEELEGEIKIAERKLDRSQEELRGLTVHLFTVQEEERQRVARELHDDISQRLSLLEILFQEIKGLGSKEVSQERITAALEQIHSLNNDVRQISHRLHPAILNDLGLSAALKNLITEFGAREKMPVNYLSRSLPDKWSQQTATAIYRIAQEALRNVAKHAGKTHVKVFLAGIEGHLQLKVMDFGVGFDQDVESPVPGLGMVSMQERARLAGGTLTVQSALGQGTTVTAEIPLNQHSP